ncbi:MAG TPA: glycosyltransferase [Aggregatilineales bacterium]|nr:glycosyltransferase family 1 protein [Anaerolineales bacterium]HRE48110.1 glycosyltransferase [Aggregatilineales bacterium]
MASIWFLSAPLAGHADWGGMLKTAQSLQRRGHDVLWVSQPALEELIAESGIPFAAIAETGWHFPPPLPDSAGMSPAEGMFLRYRRALDTWLNEALIPAAVEAILALANERGTPATFVSDPFLTAAALAAEALNVPLIAAGWGAGQPLDEDRLYAVQRDLGAISRERIAALTAHLGLRGINFSGGAAPFMESPYLHLTYFSPSWYQGDPPFLPQTEHVGGIVTAPRSPAPEWLSALPPDAPLALITLGSVFTGDLGFFAWSAQAAARLGMIPLVVIGRLPITAEDKAKLKAALPPGTRLLRWVDYDQVFPRLQVIIHHGGMGTTHRAVIQGLPQVVVPHAADQRGQARRIAQAKVGLNLSAHDVRRGQLLPAIRAVTTDRKVAENARALAAEFASLGGVDRAAERIEMVIKDAGG